MCVACEGGGCVGSVEYEVIGELGGWPAFFFL